MATSLEVLVERVENVKTAIDDFRQENREAHSDIKELVEKHEDRIKALEIWREGQVTRTRILAVALVGLQAVMSTIAGWFGAQK